MRIPLSEVLDTAGAFFVGESPIHKAAQRLAQALGELDIPFALAGALAVGAHGRVRLTEDVDVLLTPSGLAAFKARWLGRGWLEKFAGSRGLRDTVCGVNVDVRVTGDYPGDGRPKPVAFPNPAEAAEPDARGLPVLKLPALVELELASGMTAPHRLQDLADVIQLIRVNRLPQEYAQQLDPYVRPKFLELWPAAQVEEDY